MSNVSSVSKRYDNLIERFGEEKLNQRYNSLLEMYKAFIESQNLKDDVYVNTILLQNAICDYFTDIDRLKSFHDIELTNSIKVIAYESYWLWRRKPLQIKENRLLQLGDSAFINDTFIYTNLMSYMLKDYSPDIYTNLTDPSIMDDVKSFMSTLSYFIKFRQCSPQVFELVIHAFFAGKQLERLNTENGQ